MIFPLDKCRDSGIIIMLRQFGGGFIMTHAYYFELNRDGKLLQGSPPPECASPCNFYLPSLLSLKGRNK